MPALFLPSSVSSPLIQLAAAITDYVSDVPSLVRTGASHASHLLAKRGEEPSHGQIIAGGILIPVLVLLSGLFAGLTLGYMSLDETQLHVLRISGTPEQRKYAEKIEPIRKNGHLLLVTLLLANMVSNETLPIIADPVLGGGAQSVVVSTVLIVIFAEIIPQSVCTRHGLYIGAKLAPFMRVLLSTFGLVAWPVAKLLEYTLGPHHGIIYRRAELKELIALHANVGQHGGDLRADTVTIIGATLDLQEKTAKQAMTPIDKVFMLSIEAKLDYVTLRQICLTGHSRIPVYEEVEIAGIDGIPTKINKILGILLVKQCVLLDPADAVPVRKIPLNKVVTVAQNEPLLGILDHFQEGRSHMAIVSRLTIEKAASVKKVVKRGLTQRIKSRVGISDSSDSDAESETEDRTPLKKGVTLRKHSLTSTQSGDSTAVSMTGRTRDEMASSEACSAEDSGGKKISGRNKRKNKKARIADPEMGNSAQAEGGDVQMDNIPGKAKKYSIAQTVFAAGREQSMPADAVLSEDAAQEFLERFDPALAPLGIITLEDVIEELIGEEIYDEFDPEGAGHGEPSSYIPPGSPVISLTKQASVPDLKAEENSALPGVAEPVAVRNGTTTPLLRPLKGLNFLSSRSRSAPPVPRNDPPSAAPVVEDVKEDEETGKEPLQHTALTDEKPMFRRDIASAEEKQAMEPLRHRVPEVVVSKPVGDVQPIAPIPRLGALQIQSAASSRAASPTTPLDRSRSRRIAHPLSGTLTPRSATPSRGGRFKSELLGVVVAEQVRPTNSTSRLAHGEGAEEAPVGENMGENIPGLNDEGKVG